MYFFWCINLTCLIFVCDKSGTEIHEGSYTVISNTVVSLIEAAGNDKEHIYIF